MTHSLIHPLDKPLKLAANLTLLYGKLPLEQRFDAAAQDGFEAVEILFPYDRPPAWYAAQLRANGLQLILFNSPVDAGPLRVGIAGIPGQQSLFRARFANLLEVAAATGCRTVHLMAGLLPAGVSVQEQRATLLDNLAWAAPLAAEAGIVLLLEALNHLDMPGYAYHEPAAAIDVLDALAQRVSASAVGLQFDLYHTAKQGLDVPAELRRALPWVRHVQIAGAPQRHEPDLSRDGLLEAFGMLAEAGYGGWIGCEYVPASEPRAGLAWTEPLTRHGWIAALQASR